MLLPNYDKLVWCDVETTGLDPATGKLLEVGMIATDRRLEILGVRSLVIGHRDLPADIDPAVDKMHNASGLYDEVFHSRWTLKLAQSHFVDWLTDIGFAGCRMAGSNIGFDRAWLAVHMPGLLGALHWASVDVTGLRWHAKARSGLLTYPGPKVHRALPDLFHNLREVRHYCAN